MALILEKHKMPVQDPEVRAHNFEEVALGYDEETAVAEAERCLHCKVPQCKKGCPISRDDQGVECPAGHLRSRLPTGKSVREALHPREARGVRRHRPPRTLRG